MLLLQMIILFLARMINICDAAMKKVVLEVLHRHFSGYPELKEQFLKDIFGIATVC